MMGITLNIRHYQRNRSHKIAHLINRLSYCTISDNEIMLLFRNGVLGVLSVYYMGRDIPL